MKRIPLLILGCSLAMLAFGQYPVHLKFQRNGKAVRDFVLLAYYEVDSIHVLVRLPIREAHIELPDPTLPDSNVYFFVQVKRRFYPFHIDRTTIKQGMRWEFQWLTGRQHRHWAAKQDEKRPDLHAASILTHHPLEYGNGIGVLSRYRSSRKALREARAIIRSFTRPLNP